jgi:hypothetical protein
MDEPQSMCAVVGSSSALLGMGLGAEIDAHSVVIRANLAPVRSDGLAEPPFNGSTRRLRLNAGDYRRDVGERTACRLLNRQHGAQLIDELSAGTAAQYLERVRAFVGDPDRIEVVITHGKVFQKRLRMQHVRRACFANASALAEDDGASIPTALVGPLPMVLAHTGLTTSGLVAMLFALSRCHSISAYGFGPISRAGSKGVDEARDPTGAAVTYHYYQNHSSVMHKQHAFSTEHGFIRLLARAGCFGSAAAAVTDTHTAASEMYA